MQKSDMIKKLKEKVKESLDQHSYRNAIFFADKLVTIEGNIYMNFI